MYIHSMDRRTSHKSGTGRCYFGHSLEKVCFYFCIYVNIFVSFFSSAPFVLQLPVFFSFSCSIISHSSVLYFSITLSFLTYIVLCLLCFHTLFFRSLISTFFFFFHYLFRSYLCASVPVFSPPSILLVSLCFVFKLCSSDPPSFLLSSFSCFIICFVLICSIPISLCLSSSVFSSFHSPGLLLFALFPNSVLQIPLHFYFLLFPVSSFVLFLFVPFPYLCASAPVFSPPFTLLVSHSHLNCLTLPSFLSASFLSFTLCLYHVFFSFLAVCCCCI